MGKLELKLLTIFTFNIPLHKIEAKCNMMGFGSILTSGAIFFIFNQLLNFSAGSFVDKLFLQNQTGGRKSKTSAIEVYLGKLRISRLFDTFNQMCVVN